jgi:hypothetical protein
LKAMDILETEMVHLQGALGASFLPFEAASPDVGMTAIGVPNLSLKKYASLKIGLAEGTPLCLMSHRSNLLLSTLDGQLVISPWRDPHPSKIRRCYLEDILRTSISEEHLRDPSKGYACEKDFPVCISRMTYESSLNIMIWILSNGSAYLVEGGHDSWTLLNPCLEIPSETHSHSSSHAFDPSEWIMLEIDISESGKSKWEYAVSVCLNAEFRMLAIGTKLGNIFVYRIEGSPSNGAQLSPLLSHRCIGKNLPWNQHGSMIIHDLVWATETNVLAALYGGGLALWSTFGRLISTSCEESGTPK